MRLVTHGSPNLREILGLFLFHSPSSSVGAQPGGEMALVQKRLHVVGQPPPVISAIFLALDSAPVKQMLCSSG